MRSLRCLYLGCLSWAGTTGGAWIPNPPDGTNITITAVEDTAPIDRSRWFEFRDNVFVLSVKDDVSFDWQRAIAAGSEITVPVKGFTGEPVIVEVYSRNGIPLRIHGRFQYGAVRDGVRVAVPGFQIGRARGALLPFLESNLRVPKNSVAVFVTSMAKPVPPSPDTFGWILNYWKPAPPPWVITLQQMQRHALALNGILDSQNGYFHSSLDFNLDEAEEMDQTLIIRKVLAEWWGIHSREELMDMLVKLQSGKHGHRERYWEIRKKLLEAKMEHYLETINQEGPGTPAQRFIVATHLGPIKGRSLPLTAWDFGRYIYLCRAGYNARWLTEKEAWFRILPAARLLQASYSSWDEFATDYLLGRYFWNPDVAAENESVRYIIALLKNPEGGLWGGIPWDQTLGNGQVMRDTYASSVLKNYKDPDANRASKSYTPEGGEIMMKSRTSDD
jgi:hypothetical protein